MASLRAGSDTTVTYVLVEGNTTTYKVYSWTGSAFTLYDNGALAAHCHLTPPAAPAALTATAISYARIDLTWTDNADNEASFEIERSTTGSGGPLQPADHGACQYRSLQQHRPESRKRILLPGARSQCGRRINLQQCVCAYHTRTTTCSRNM